ETRVRRHRLLAAAGLVLAAAARAGDAPRLRAVDPAELSYTYAVGAFAPEYTPPAPGSYALPTIDTVTDPALVDPDCRPTTRFADGACSGLFRHVLKVFLLDGESRVRNVYSVGLLDATLVLTDLRTLLLASRRSPG